MIGGGAWQIKIRVVPAAAAADILFQAISLPAEAAVSSRERVGEYSVTVGFAAEGCTEVWKSGSQVWKLSGSGSDSWCSESRITAADLAPPGSPDSFIVFWSIERTTETIPKPVGLDSIVANLFDDKDASNAVFIISHPRKISDKEEYIYAHTKILSASSAYFKTMFESEFSEGACSSFPSTSNTPDLGLQELLHFEDSDYEETRREPIEINQPGGTITPTDSVKYRTIRITDTSYKTYYAMLYFLYTKKYSFAPLKSDSKNRNSPPSCKTAAKNQKISESTNVPTSSAKSMYRLCHRLDIADLKAAALEHIKYSLTPENISAELSSPFTIRFAEIKAMEQDYFVTHWNEIKNTPGFGALISGLFNDQTDGAGEVWLNVFRRL